MDLSTGPVTLGSLAVIGLMSAVGIVKWLGKKVLFSMEEKLSSMVSDNKASNHEMKLEIGKMKTEVSDKLDDIKDRIFAHETRLAVGEFELRSLKEKQSEHSGNFQKLMHLGTADRGVK